MLYNLFPFHTVEINLCLMYFSVMMAERVAVSPLRQEIFKFNKFWVRDPVSGCYRYFEGLLLM